MKQNAKANTTCQTVIQTKSLNYKNVSTKITENITQNNPNTDPSNNTKTQEAINATTKDISTIIDNVIVKIAYRVQQIQSTYNVRIHKNFKTEVFKT